MISSQKATQKTDKVRPEDVDATDLSNEALKDLLLKYGLNAGPIVGKLFLRFKLAIKCKYLHNVSTAGHQKVLGDLSNTPLFYIKNQTKKRHNKKVVKL